MFERAVTAEAGGQLDEAIRNYRQALEQDPGLLKARNNLGTLYIKQNRLAEAIEQFQAALTLAPTYAYARNNLGSAYLMMGQETEAIQEFLAALRLDGSYVSPYYNLAAIYARRRDLAHVVAFLTKAIALEPAVLSWMSADADFDGIRTAPAFRHLAMTNHARR
jgi:tetratricopeptide (TPR) repeat protein